MLTHPTMSDDLNRVPILGIIGLAALLGAATLAYFSSVVTLRLERSATEATLSYDTRLFNLFAIEQRRHQGVTGVYLRPGREPGSRSHTPDFVIFRTADGIVDYSYAQQLFLRDYPELEAFFADAATPALTLSSIARGSELRRFIAAQAAVVFLAAVGLGSWYGAWRGLVGSSPRRA